MITSAEARRNVALREVESPRSTLARHCVTQVKRPSTQFEDVALNRERKRTQRDESPQDHCEPEK